MPPRRIAPWPDPRSSPGGGSAGGESNKRGVIRRWNRRIERAGGITPGVAVKIIGVYPADPFRETVS